ncbi:MAG: NADPH:quinone oxidoreductase family protein [Gammaproteobacteria bacterium]|nr:NADPH:quinone oxidoreductase family protein [Gammaproteobacteria bacterium]
MRALVCREYGTPETMRIEEWDDPVPGDDEIVFDVRAAGLNFADVLMIAGQYQVRTPPPFIPGNEAAGVVSAVGRNVTRFRVGDAIVGALRGGAFAEKSVVAEASAIALPASLSFEQGAAYSVAYGTSYHALKQGARLQPGETVLVLGAAGGVGYAAVEIAGAMGAHVIAAASSGDKLAFAREAGADELINYSEQPLKITAKTLTDGRGVDVVYDPVGGELAEQALRACAWHARFLVVGFASGDIPRLPANLALLKEASIIGVWYGTWAEKHADEFAGNIQDLERMVDAGQLQPRCSQSFALEDFADAFRLITERRVLGKVVLTPATNSA